MSCNITQGRTASCKDAIAGLLNVYFVNRFTDTGALDSQAYFGHGDPNIADGVLTFPATPGTPSEAFKYELHMGNDLTQNIQASPENGTFYLEQVLNLTLKKLSSADNVRVAEMAAARPYVYVEDQMGNVMLVGRINGVDLTGGTAVTGNDFGDLNGYTLTFTGREKELAPFVSPGVYSSAVEAFSTYFDVQPLASDPTP